MTYKRIFETHTFPPGELAMYREENFKYLEDDRMRCQHCQGFYWRLWFDQAQCLSCQHYSMLEVGVEDPTWMVSGTKQLEFGFVQPVLHNLLAVQWVREQLTGKELIDINRRIKDPLSDRTEFIIFKDRIRCRVTGTETQIKPEITAFWILKSIPKVEGKTLTGQQALDIVRQSKLKENADGNRDIDSLATKEDRRRDSPILP